MAAFWGDSTQHTGIVRGRVYTVTTACTSMTTTYTISDLGMVSNANYITVYDPPPKAEIGSALALDRMALLGINPLRLDAVRMPESIGMARAFRHLPRGKLDRWPSLKEKRLAWGDFS